MGERGRGREIHCQHGQQVKTVFVFIGEMEIDTLGQKIGFTGEREKTSHFSMKIL